MILGVKLEPSLYAVADTLLPILHASSPLLRACPRSYSGWFLKEAVGCPVGV